MDGFELVQRMRADPNLADTAVIMLTSADQQGDIARCRKVGINCYLVKPIHNSELRSAIEMVMQQFRSPAQGTLITRSGMPAEQSSWRIFVAEDNAVNQKFLQRLLERMGHLTVVANDGKQAVAFLRDRQL